jgi:hypothetical protein
MKLSSKEIKGELVPFWIALALQSGRIYHNLLSSDCRAKDRPSVTVALNSYNEGEGSSMTLELIVNNAKFSEPNDNLWFEEESTTRIVYMSTRFSEALDDYHLIEKRAIRLNEEDMHEEAVICTD